MIETSEAPTNTEALALVNWEIISSESRQSTFEGIATLTGKPHDDGALLTISELYTPPDGKECLTYASLANDEKAKSVSELVTWLNALNERKLFDKPSASNPFLNGLFLRKRPPELTAISAIRVLRSANTIPGSRVGESFYVNALGGLVITASHFNRQRQKYTKENQQVARKIILSPSTTKTFVGKLVELA
ncbi:MAG TPA: hypothetical protein VFN31_00095 [Candidatus Saccharimonadales bacterium]|nr:hypothetical protein [Candidatus Saccharimonadales bacterium]